jgi:Rod binding domain-containing protein
MLLPTTPRLRTEWPGQAGATPTPADVDAVAQRFEALIAESLLKSARAAGLGDDSLGEDSGGGGDHVRAMIDHARAEAIARAAPMGIARVLAAENARVLAAENARARAAENAPARAVRATAQRPGEAAK